MKKLHYTDNIVVLSMRSLSESDVKTLTKIIKEKELG